MTMSPTASPTQAPTPVPAPVEDPVAACGAYIYTCEALKRAVEYERVNRTDACGFNLAINMTCGSSITIPSGIEIEINGLLPSERDEELNATTTTAADDDVSATARGRRLLPSGSVGGTNDSRSWLFAGNGCCGDEDDGDTAAAVDSLFVIESGGKLTLTNLGFQVATTNANMRNISVRAVYSSGELYVDGCDLVGPSSEDVNDRGGAVSDRKSSLCLLFLYTAVLNAKYKLFKNIRRVGLPYLPHSSSFSLLLPHILLYCDARSIPGVRSSPLHRRPSVTSRPSVREVPFT